MKKLFYRRNLPHIIPDDAQFFVTFTLNGALPINVIERLQNEKEERLKNAIGKGERKEDIEKIYYGKYDDLLANSKNGVKWLENEELSKIVSNKLFEFDNKKYKLICFCIMPNHVHLLIDTKHYTPKELEKKGSAKDYYLADIMRLVKGNTSRKCNLILNKTGSFWQAESYDHFVRDRNELYRIISYILYNPVKAKLCNEIKAWKWTYIKEEYNEFI